MTDVAASDLRHPRRYVRLDTILRLRWLAVLGQLAAIFIVAQGLEFDLPVVPCVTIIGLSALLTAKVAGATTIIAVDLNPNHIALTRLKLAALKELPNYDAFFRFFGEANDKANSTAFDDVIA